MGNTKEVLLRLKRRLGRERSRFDRFYREATNPSMKERAYGEANVCGLAMGFIDDELSKLKRHGGD
jgi:hypothetical protein